MQSLVMLLNETKDLDKYGRVERGARRGAIPGERCVS
jgi:hypothetical protein